MKLPRFSARLIFALTLILVIPSALSATDAVAQPASAGAEASTVTTVTNGTTSTPSGLYPQSQSAALNLVASATNNAWVLFSACLVFFMTIPGLALFYGGLVKRKNVLSVFMECFACVAIVSVLWVAVGFSLAFSDKELIPGLLGDFKYAFMHNVGTADAGFWVSQPNAPVNSIVYALFQMMFAIITPALIIGSCAERFRFSHFVAFTVAWLFLVYVPITHAVWNPHGFLYKMGVLDFAGGTVVEINGGFAGIIAAVVMGKRRNLRPTPPHNLIYTLIGAAMLWFGWFGFNAGSGLAADGIAANAFLTTNTAGAVSAIVWAALDWIYNKKPTMLGVATGAVAGLVAITPAAGFVNAEGAFIIGAAAALACWVFVVIIKSKIGYDDSLDCFGVHGIGGLVGTLLVGVLADPSVWKPFGQAYAGAAYGHPGQFLIQLKAAIFALVWTSVGTFIIIGLLRLLGARASEKDQAMGLDISQHNERAYTVIE
jgi:Amt family ammonium transporter